MSFNGSEGEMISLEDASTWTANYRNDSTYNGIKAHYFGRNNLRQILEQTNCVGIRMYYGIDAEGLPIMILVGVDSNENDLYEGLILDRSVPCPSYCGGNNPLNS